MKSYINCDSIVLQHANVDNNNCAISYANTILSQIFPLVFVANNIYESHNAIHISLPAIVLLFADDLAVPRIATV